MSNSLVISSQFQPLKVIVGLFLLFVVSNANAVLIGGVDFPQGEISFADALVTYNPDGGGAIPTAPNNEPNNALGIPEIPGNTSMGACSGIPADCPFVSLGDGGFIILEFVDNLLTGSDNNADDLWIFEVGLQVEDTFVAISKDGNIWHDVGKVFGATSGVDIDSFGFSASDLFRFIKLTDDTAEGGQSGASVGADIDAVGAIATVPAAVPVPAAFWLFLSGLAAITGFSRRG